MAESERRGRRIKLMWWKRLSISGVTALKAPPGFEPGMADLQSAALAAWLRRHPPKRTATFLARQGRSNPVVFPDCVRHVYK